MEVVYPKGKDDRALCLCVSEWEIIMKLQSVTVKMLLTAYSLSVEIQRRHLYMVRFVTIWWLVSLCFTRFHQNSYQCSRSQHETWSKHSSSSRLLSFHFKHIGFNWKDVSNHNCIFNKKFLTRFLLVFQDLCSRIDFVLSSVLQHFHGKYFIMIFVL